MFGKEEETRSIGRDIGGTYLGARISRIVLLKFGRAIGEGWHLSMNTQSDCLAVFDLEYTAWEGSEERQWSGPDEDPEIIQFGAVVMRLDSNVWQPSKTFQMYVRPMLRPILSDYIKALTGVTQDTIDHSGMDFGVALNAFKSFIPLDALLHCNGRDDIVLKENCILHDIDFPFDEEDFVNVRPFIKEKLGIIHKFSSSDLADILGFKERKKHDALSDALVIAKTLIELRWGSNL